MSDKPKYSAGGVSFVILVTLSILAVTMSGDWNLFWTGLSLSVIGLVIGDPIQRVILQRQAVQREAEERQEAEERLKREQAEEAARAAKAAMDEERRQRELAKETRTKEEAEREAALEAQVLLEADQKKFERHMKNIITAFRAVSDAEKPMIASSISEDIKALSLLRLREIIAADESAKRRLEAVPPNLKKHDMLDDFMMIDLAEMLAVADIDNVTDM